MLCYVPNGTGPIDLSCCKPIPAFKLHKEGYIQYALHGCLDCDHIWNSRIQAGFGLYPDVAQIWCENIRCEVFWAVYTGKKESSLCHLRAKRSDIGHNWMQSKQRLRYQIHSLFFTSQSVYLNSTWFVRHLSQQYSTKALHRQSV